MGLDLAIYLDRQDLGEEHSQLPISVPDRTCEEAFAVRRCGLVFLRFVRVRS